MLGQAGEPVVGAEVGAIFPDLRAALAFGRLREGERRGGVGRDEIRRRSPVVVTFRKPRAVDRRIDDGLPMRDPRGEPDRDFGREVRVDRFLLGHIELYGPRGGGIVVQLNFAALGDLVVGSRHSILERVVEIFRHAHDPGGLGFELRRGQRAALSGGSFRRPLGGLGLELIDGRRAVLPLHIGPIDKQNARRDRARGAGAGANHLGRILVGPQDELAVEKRERKTVVLACALWIGESFQIEAQRGARRLKTV